MVPFSKFLRRDVLSVREKEIFTHYHVTALFVGGGVYLLSPAKKHASRIDLARGGAADSLGGYVNPLAVLLDRKLAENRFDLEVSDQDDWYTYLTVKPKHVKQFGWFTERLGRITIIGVPALIHQQMPHPATARHGAGRIVTVAGASPRSGQRVGSSKSNWPTTRGSGPDSRMCRTSARNIRPFAAASRSSLSASGLARRCNNASTASAGSASFSPFNLDVSHRRRPHARRPPRCARGRGPMHHKRG